MAKIKITDVEQVGNSGEYSITCTITGLDKNYSYQRTVWWYLEGEWDGTSYVSPNASSGGAYTFSGLEANTTYYISAEIYLPDTGNIVSVEGKYQTTGEEVRPKPDTPDISYWDWNESNGDASARETRAAYLAITKKGKTSDFSYLVWNDLCYKIREIREALDGDPWTSTYGLSFESTLMDWRDTVLTAKRFNSLRINIDDAVDIAGLSRRYKTGYVNQSKGDTVFGSYFIQMTSVMNTIIEKALV